MTETERFMQYAKNVRRDFHIKTDYLFDNATSKDRIVIEGLLICFDQMAERLQNIYSVSISSPILPKVSDEAINTCPSYWGKSDMGRHIRDLLLPLITQQAATIQQQQEEIEKLRNKLIEHVYYHERGNSDDLDDLVYTTNNLLNNPLKIYK